MLFIKNKIIHLLGGESDFSVSSGILFEKLLCDNVTFMLNILPRLER